MRNVSSPTRVTPSSDATVAGASDDDAAERPRTRERPGDGQRRLPHVDGNDGVGLDPGRHLFELACNGGEQLLASGGIARRCFGDVRVERRLERGVLGEGGRLTGQVALTPELERREQTLHRFQAADDRLAHLDAHRVEHHREHDHQQQRDQAEGHRERLQEERRRLTRLAHGASCTGSERSIDAVRPPCTSMVSLRSPTRSCQPTIVYLPAGTSGSVKLPSSAAPRSTDGPAP